MTSPLPSPPPAGDDAEQPAAEQLAARLRALAHPVRMTVLRTLSGRAGCVCGEIVRVLPLAQSTVSQHIKVLAEAGLVRGAVDGPRSCYCIDRDAVRALSADLQTFLAALAPDAAAPGGPPETP